MDFLHLNHLQQVHRKQLIIKRLPFPGILTRISGNIRQKEAGAGSYRGQRNDSHEHRSADEDLGHHELAHGVIPRVFHLPGDLLGPRQAAGVVDLKIHLQDLVGGRVCSGKQSKIPRNVIRVLITKRIFVSLSCSPEDLPLV